MNRFLHALYCDDLREEVGNKVSLIGVYGTELLLAKLPAVVPKFAILVTAGAPATNPFRQFECRVSLDENILVQTKQAPSDLEALTIGWDGQPEDESPSGSGRVQLLRFVFMISPFSLPNPGILRVTATTESGVLRCPALAIREASAREVKEHKMAPLP